MNEEIQVVLKEELQKDLNNIVEQLYELCKERLVEDHDFIKKLEGEIMEEIIERLSNSRLKDD